MSKIIPAPILLVAAMLLAACEGREPEAESTSPAPEMAAEPAQPEADTGPAQASRSTLAPQMLSQAEYTEILLTGDGAGRVYVLVECTPTTGGNLIAINPVGFEEGLLVEARGEPAFGGAVTAQVGPGGSGVGMRQTTLSAAEYTLRIELEGETLETAFPGCG